MAKAFASAADLAPKKVTFDKLADGVFACTAEGDPNTGVIVGDNEVLVFDAQATPVMAERSNTVISLRPPPSGCRASAMWRGPSASQVRAKRMEASRSARP